MSTAQNGGVVEAGQTTRVAAILARLQETYPDARCSLNFASPLQLLVATILAAQCTDERVNAITPALFARYQSAAAFAHAPLEELEEAVRPTGFFRNKARNIQGACRMIVREFDGEVPHTMAELLRLPGVARKTANVVLGNAFGIVVGVVVDTHVGRISRRLGLTTQQDPVRVEQELMAILPREQWLDYTHRVILFGRAICKAPRARCSACFLNDLCPSAFAEGA
ncbi:MAG TPA: endonuclease III [Chloroflexota bacterium]|nr:endonuclease III [Chloroflexota bacterium]